MDRTLTFVVGAGASSELGLPVGADLVKQIASICEIRVDEFGNVLGGDNSFVSALRVAKTPDLKANSIALLARQADEIRHSMGLALSIDNYLDAHKDNPERVMIGKLAIALALQIAERESSLWRDPKNLYNRVNFAALPDNWLVELFRILATGQSKGTFGQRLGQCNFISFNYDRAIEQFFYHASKSYFELEDGEASDLCVQSLNVIHPYGTVGKFEYDSVRTGFGETDRGSDLLQASYNIRTFAEGVSDQDLTNEMRRSIDTSDALIFLGFAFHPLNIQALAPNNKYSCCRVLGTCLGMSEDNLSITRNELQETFFGQATNFEFHPQKCFSLVRDFAAYLSGR